MVQDYEHLTSPHWLLQPEPRWVQAVYLGWVTFECQRALSRRLSLCILQTAVAVHFSLKMINILANYQSTGTHSSMGDGNQEIVIWRTRSFWLWYYFALISFHLADAYLLFNLPAVLAIRLFYAFIYLSGLWHEGPTEVKRCFSQGSFGCRNLSFHNLPTVNQTALSLLLSERNLKSHIISEIIAWQCWILTNSSPLSLALLEQNTWSSHGIPQLICMFSSVIGVFLTDPWIHVYAYFYKNSLLTFLILKCPFSFFLSCKKM